MKTSCVVVAYNYLELAKVSIESVIEKSSKDVEIIIVDNHSPDKRTSEYINSIKAENVKIIDAGKNIGCHNGFALGFKHAKGDYLVKLDDDTVVETQDWDKEMISTLEKYMNIAFIAPRSNVEQTGQLLELNGGFTQKMQGIVGFSMVMFPREFYEKYVAKAFTSNKRLYGGEEVLLAQAAIENGLIYGYSENTKISHIANEDRPVLYVLWKEFYGLWGKTDKDYSEFKDDEEEIKKAFMKWTVDSNEWKQERADEYLNNKKGKYFFK